MRSQHASKDNDRLEVAVPLKLHGRMDTVCDNGNILNFLEVRNHMKSRGARIHENGIAASDKTCSLCAYGILKINVGNGSYHVVLAAVRRHLVRKLDPSVESYDRAFSLKGSDICSYRSARNA